MRPIKAPPLRGLKYLARLPSGAIYIDSDLDTDDDGSPRFHSIDPRWGQRETSLSLNHKKGQRRWVNSERVPYIVLPLNLYRRLGIRLGDVAAVMWKGRVVYAIFADEGPNHLIGEGSVALSEALGFNPWEKRGGRMQIVNGIERGVVTIVFPHSAPRGLRPENINTKIALTARRLFVALGGQA